MTMLPIWKTCPLCNKKYSWNPDVGQMLCPYCSGKKEKPENLFEKIFKKEEKDK